MTNLGRLARFSRAWKKFSSPKTLNPPSASSSDLLSRRISHGFLKQHISSNEHTILQGNMVPDILKSSSMFPAILVGLFGAGALEIVFADVNEDAAQPPLASESPKNYLDLEEIAKKERQRIEEQLREKGLQYGSYPRFTVAVKGQKVTMRFQIAPGSELAQLIANLAAKLGVKVEERGGGGDMLLRSWNSAVAWQLTLNTLEKQKEAGGNLEQSKDMNTNEGDLCIVIFHSLISSDRAEIEFIKKGSLSPKELDAFVSTLQLAGGKLAQNRTLERRPQEGNARASSTDKSVSKLEAMGVKIFGLHEPQGSSSYKEISWENIAGYDQQKRDIEDTVLMALQSPEVYDDIARGTRCKFESNRPRAVLFESPPGTGKTSCARVIANQAVSG